MFRAASKLKTLQHGARQRVVPVQLASHYSGLIPLGDKSDNSTAPRPGIRVNASRLLKSVRNTHKISYQPGNTAILGRRGFATSSDNNGSSSSEVDATLDRLFQENEVFSGKDVEPWVDGAQSVASSGLDFIPTWYNPADICIQVVLKVEEVAGVELGLAIIGTTFLARLVLFPVVVASQKSASRMAHVQPELKQMQQRYEKIKNPSLEEKSKMGQDVQKIFHKYEVKPVRSMLGPFVQLPFMMGMFFGLKKMPDYFPEEMANGGILWFPDLTVTDPNFILPGICFLTFLGTVELGKEQMLASGQGPMMLNVFRGLSIFMIPVMSYWHAGLLCYFTVSNGFTLLQIAIMKYPPIKTYLGIWDPPKPVPGASSQGLWDSIKDLTDKAQGKPVTDADKITKHNQMVDNKRQFAEMSKNRSDRRQRRSIKKRT